MAYLNLRVPAGADVAERLCDALAALGALAVSVEDAAAGTAAEQPIYGEPGTSATALWPSCLVTALVEASVEPRELLRDAARLAGLPAIGQWRAEAVAEHGWVELTQAQFQPIAISRRLWIVPTWHDPPDPDAINLRLDPGAAFGTGSHPTTRLCLQWLEETLLPGERVIDYGCGSGILAIAALKLGATDACGIDIDPLAVAAARANAAANGVQARFGLPESGKPAQADALVANILANPLRVLAPLLGGLVKPGGRLALSGILPEQAGELVGCYAPWFDLAPWREAGGWVCLAGTRTGSGTAG